MYFKERCYEIAKQNIRIFTHIAFIANDINPGNFIGGIALADGVIAVAILAVGDTRIGNINRYLWAWQKMQVKMSAGLRSFFMGINHIG